MNQTLKRINYIDIMKAIGIILVILGHINFANNNIRTYIYAFHMPLFFLCYGMTYKKKEYNFSTLKNLTMSRIKSLYIPYILWALIYSSLTPKNLIYILYGSHLTLKIDNNSSLWFLPCFFISVMLFELLNSFIYHKKLKDNSKNIFYCITILFSIIISVLLPSIPKYGYPLGFNVSFMGLTFIIIGNFTVSFIKKLKLENLDLRYLIVIFIILFLGTFTYKLNNVDYVLMAENIYGNIFLFLFTALIGCFAIIILSILLDKILLEKIKKFLIFIGQNTLIILATQKPIISLMARIISYFNISLPNIILLAVTTILTLAFCIVCIKLSGIFIPELNGKRATTSSTNLS